MIGWKYIDLKAAAAEAIKDYHSMEFIMTETPDEITNLREDMVAPGSPNLSGLPSVFNPQGGADKLVAQIDALDVLRHRYVTAAEYMAWFKPAWETLDEDDRYVLTEFYINEGGKQVDAITAICERLSIERSSAYNKKNRALARLSRLLYGK